MEKVSVVITTHNRLDCLKQTIRSVEDQTYANIEIIIVDDGSIDGTKIYCENLPNIQYIYIPPELSKGGNHARNIGIKECSGSYIALLDDDDIWYSEKIEKQVSFLRGNPECGVVYCGRKFISNNHELLERELPIPENRGDCSKRILYNIIGVTSMLMCRSELLKSMPFDERLSYWQEYEWMIRVCQKTQIGYVNEILMEYMQNLDGRKQLSSKVDGWFESVDYINEKYQDLIQQLSAEEKNKRQIMIYYDAVSRYSISRNKRKRREYLFKIFLMNKNFKNFLKWILNIDRIQLLRLKRVHHNMFKFEK